MQKLEKVIYGLFVALLFFVPLILWPYTSELFEFNKMVLVYILTVLIVSAWVVRMIYERKFIFRRTILDIPFIVFFGSQAISTLMSIDIQTSFLGYYSRFNGGLASTICYLLLYWAFVSNIKKSFLPKLAKFGFASAAIVSLYGVAEHFGIDKNIWQQDVASRVFSTLGQPNWLAAWLVALIPISWVLMLEEKTKSKKYWAGFALSVLFFWVLVFTKSRSGILGFGVAFIGFWGSYFWLKRKNINILLPTFGIITASVLVVSLISETQFTPSVKSLLGFKSPKIETVAMGAALETGGTESGTIRGIVWKGAINIWKHYPIFGTGVETFGFSYYLFRPIEHNLTSEWDFIYNKAHNEYLNFAANSGTVGILSYLVVVGFAVYLIVKNTNVFGRQKDESGGNFSLALLSGYVSILVTNFFGFSVVPIQLLFFLYPAFSVVLAVDSDQKERGFLSPTQNQKTLAVLVAVIDIIFLIAIGKYWYADTLYAKAQGYTRVSRQDLSEKYLNRAIKIEPKQAIYYSDLGRAYANLALAYSEAKDSTVASQLSQLAVESTLRAVDLSPANLNLKRNEFAVFIMLSNMNTDYLLNARDTLEAAIKQAPTDAKILYNLGLLYTKTGENELALQTLAKTIELKSNYKDARLAYAVLLMAEGENSEARTQLEYILEKIDPSDSKAKSYLNSIR